MKFLIDTLILLWWLSDDPALSSHARKYLTDEKHIIFVSDASIWEIIIKKAIGKLQAPDDIESVLKENNFEELPITLRHVLMIEQLEHHHHDPFDRMLIAQAKCEGHTLITADRKFANYDISHVIV